jgi:hypothetical protein
MVLGHQPLATETVMSSPSTSIPTSKVTVSGDIEIDALLKSLKWGGGVGTGLSITFSFPWKDGAGAVFSGPDGASYSKLDEPDAAQHYGLNAMQQSAVTTAMQAWSNVANITATLISENSTSVGDIRVGWTSAKDITSTGETAWGWAYEPNNHYASGGDIWLSTASSAATSTDWAAGSYNYEALMHELGHTLGLKHPFDGTPVLDAAHDNRLYTLMAYDEAPNSLFVDVTESGGTHSWRSYTVNPDTPMLYDIAAMQYLYGANMSYHTGADTYTFDPTTPFLRTIWDAGGNDTISVANFSTDCVIDLRQGAFSSIRIPSDSTAGYNWTKAPPVATYDGSNNLAIAFGAVIENATGGSGNDTLIGNSSANLLQGNAGNDVLDGGAGIDTAVYTGSYDQYVIKAATGGYTVALRADGSQDALSNIERLAFRDGTLALDMNSLADDALQAQYVALAQKFYVAYFGRPADANGLANMVAQFAAAKVPTTTEAFASAYYTSATVKALVDSFGNSAESAALYHGSNDDFVTGIYAHLLGRTPDQEGLDYWSGTLDAGSVVRGLAALSIMAGAEANTTTQGKIDAALIANRVTVAGNFTAILDLPSEVAGYAGDAAAAAARALLDGVRQDTSIIAYESNVFGTVARMAGGALGAAPEVVLVGIGTAGHDGLHT